MKSFPNPLTASEEKYYIQRYTEGDLEAKHILIERNLRLVAHVIKKYQNLDEDPEDLLSIGTIGLIKAVVTFNPDKGNRLAAYASRCVEKATPPVWLHLTIRRLISTLFPNFLYHDPGTQIKQFRRQHSYSQEQLADKLDVWEQSIRSREKIMAATKNDCPVS